MVIIKPSRNDFVDSKVHFLFLQEFRLYNKNLLTRTQLNNSSSSQAGTETPELEQEIQYLNFGSGSGFL